MFVSFLALVKLSVNEKSFSNALTYFKLTGIYMYLYKHMCVTWIPQGTDAQM